MKRSSIWTPIDLAEHHVACRARWPSMSSSGTVCSHLHSSAQGEAATRGGLHQPRRRGSSPVAFISLAPRGSGAEVPFIWSRRSKVARLQTNSFGLLDEGDRILVAFAGEHHDRRLVGDAVEERVGREVDLALRAHRGDPADRPRRDDRLERIVRQAVVVLARVVEHGAAFPRDSVGAVARDDLSSGGRGRSSGGFAGRADMDEARDPLVGSQRRARRARGGRRRTIR